MYKNERKKNKNSAKKKLIFAPICPIFGSFAEEEKNILCRIYKYELWIIILLYRSEATPDYINLSICYHIHMHLLILLNKNNRVSIMEK